MGPRFQLKLYEIKLGTIDIADAADTEWALRPYMNTSFKRRYLSAEDGWTLEDEAAWIVYTLGKRRTYLLTYSSGRTLRVQSYSGWRHEYRIMGRSRLGEENEYVNKLSRIYRRKCFDIFTKFRKKNSWNYGINSIICLCDF